MTYINYIDLPNGRERRLAYSHQIQLTNRQIYSGVYINSIPHTDLSELDNYFSTLNMNNYSINSNSSISSSDNEENNFDNLIDIKKGIISVNLYEKSTVKLNKYIDCNCCICYERITNDEIIRELYCKHYFHINCVDRWFTENKSCPECRSEL